LTRSPAALDAAQKALDLARAQKKTTLAQQIEAWQRAQSEKVPSAGGAHP
jgi:hypothetical protein